MCTEEGRRLLRELRLKELPSGKNLEFYFQGLFNGIVKRNPDGSIKPSGETLQKREEWFLDQLPTLIYWAFDPWGGTINYDYYNNFITKLKDHEVYRLHVLSTFLKKLNEYSKKAEEKTEKFRKTISKIQVMFRKKRACIEI